MARPLRSADDQPRSETRPILPPRIDGRTHLDVAQAYLELGLPDEAMFELSLVQGDSALAGEAKLLAARIKNLQPAAARGIPRPPQQPRSTVPTRIDGLRARSRVVSAPRPTAPEVVPSGSVDEAIDRVFEERFTDVDESPTSPD